MEEMTRVFAKGHRFVCWYYEHQVQEACRNGSGRIVRDHGHRQLLLTGEGPTLTDRADLKFTYKEKIGTCQPSVTLKRYRNGVFSKWRADEGFKRSRFNPDTIQTVPGRRVVNALVN